MMAKSTTKSVTHRHSTICMLFTQFDVTSRVVPQFAAKSLGHSNKVAKKKATLHRPTKTISAISRTFVKLFLFTTNIRI